LDENLHLAATQMMLRLLKKEDPDYAKIAVECHDEVQQMFMDAIEQEEEWADYLFKDGSIIGLNAQILKDYIRWIGSRRMNSVSTKCPYSVSKSNPLPWTEFNWGNFDKPEDMENACDLSVRALDSLLDYQDYPVGHAERATNLYRPLGVGIINLAYFLAKRGLRYDDGALDTMNVWTEAWSYYLLKSSVQLAKEKGRCEGFENLKYAKGILPIDTYKRSVDELVSTELLMDWDTLRGDIAKHGIRNATTMALMPAETSAQISNSTNGIEPPRSLVSIKASKDGILKQVVPEVGKLKNKYTLLWDMKDCSGYIKIVAVLQKYIDQSISANTSYNPANYENGKLSMKMLLGDILLGYRLGVKNFYYMNTNDQAGEVDVSGVSADALAVEIQLPDLPDEVCDSCTI